MTSRIRLNEAEITKFLQELCDEEIEGSDSEIEDNLIEDDVQSDIEDCEIAPPPLVSLSCENTSQIDPGNLESTSSSTQFDCYAGTSKA